MPGANCSIFGCTTSRRSTGVSIFRVPRGDEEWEVSWRNRLVDIVTKGRETDSVLHSQIKNRSIHICERHFSEDDLIKYETRSKLKPGSIPTKNLPIRSFEKSDPTPRLSAVSIMNKRNDNTPYSVTPSVPSVCYTSYENFVYRVGQLKLPQGWSIHHTTFTSVIFNDSVHMLPKFEVFIDEKLSFTIRVFTWCISEQHIIYTKYDRSMKNITLSNLIKYIQEFNLCEGSREKIDSHHFVYHNIPIIPVNLSDFTKPKHEICYLRMTICDLLCKSIQCHPCLKQETICQKNLKRKQEKSVKPINLNAPISRTSSTRLKATIQHFRIENKELKQELDKLQSEIQTSSLKVPDDLNDDLKFIISKTPNDKITPFMKMFWEEQQKYLSSSKNAIRYHPMIIRYCLNLVAKSPALYDQIRYDENVGTGFLMLPSRRRLRDYKNYITPKQGFNHEIINELELKTKDFSNIEKYMVILFDEMKIQDKLVWDKHTGDIIGYVNLGDKELNYATLEKADGLATSVLVFLLRSIVNPFKFTLANFATTGVTSSQLFPLFWKAVGICENKCNLKIIATTCDGASPNRKFFRMHFPMQNDEDVNNTTDVCYRTRNLFDPSRFIYFISDPPHLLKTVRNCLYNSGAGNNKRFMWNDGSTLSWKHISEMFYEDRECGLHLLPKITEKHIKLTPFSIMNVRLAAQVLSLSMGNILREFGPKDASETANLCLLMDQFFDSVNIRSKNESSRELKPFRKVFTNADDSRLKWLTDVFLKYFKDWQSSVGNRPGKYSQKYRNSMFISYQSYEGLQITAHSMVEIIPYLLNNNVSYVLTERFSQDPLENYFGHQRSMGSRKDNPTMRDFGYNDNTIRNLKVFRPIQGSNVVSSSADSAISNDPVPCRRKKSKTAD